jgi:hypothetical protein
VAVEVDEVVGRQDEHGDAGDRGPLDLGDEPVPVAGVGEKPGVLDEGAVAESPVGPQRRARVGRFRLVLDAVRTEVVVDRPLPQGSAACPSVARQ